MKKILSLLVLVSLFLGTSKVFSWPVYDPFNYPPGQGVWGQYDTNTQDYWSGIDTGASPANAIIIATNVLTYPGLPASPGYSFLMTNVNGAQGPRMFITSNAVNWPGNAGGNVLNNIHVMTSFVLDVTNMANLYSSGGEHYTLGYNDQGSVSPQGGNPGTMVTRLYYQAVQDGTGTNYQVGIAKQNGRVYATNILSVNQQHLIVFDEFLTNDPTGTTGNETNDYIYLWVDPPAGSFGAQAAPAYSAVIGPGSPSSVNGFGLTPYTSCIIFEDRDVNAPVALIGQFRFGTNWSWMTGGACISNNQAGPVNEYVGAPFSLTSTPFYNGSLNTYQWTYNGVNLTNGPSVSGTGATVSGATTTNLSLVNQTLSDSGSYAIVVSNAVGVFTSAVSVVTVFPPTPAAVAVEPAPAVMPLYAGGTTHFFFTPIGAPPITYYWYSNNTAVGTTTNVSSFFFTNISANASVYCLLSNQFGTAYTVTNTIQLLPTPTAPYLQAVLQDRPVDLWPLNEHPDNGAGNTGTLALDNMGGNDGVYNDVIIAQPGYGIGLSNEFSYPPSTPVTDTNLAGEFGYYPAEPATNSYVGGISNIDFSAPANSPPFSVEAWVNAEGNTEAQFGVSPHQSSTIVAKGWGNYGGGANEFVLEYASGSPGGWVFYIEDASGLFFSTSYNAGIDGNWHHLVATWVEPTPASPVTAQSLYMDGVLVASNYNGYAYSNGTNTIGIYSASAPLTIGSSPSTLSFENANVYDQNFFGEIADVAIYNYALTANQVSNHYYAAGIPPSISVQPPSSTNISYGSTLTLSASVVGTAPLSYQWIDGNTGQPIAGQTNATLVINNDTANDSYTLQVTSPYGTATSQSASVNAVQGVQLAQDIAPTSPDVQAGSTVTFTTTVIGAAPITYWWVFNNGSSNVTVANNGRISGATSNNLTISDIQLSDAGTYQMFASNAYGGPINSSMATLVVSNNLSFFDDSGNGWSIQSTPSYALQFTGGGIVVTLATANEDTSTFYSYPVYIGGFNASFIYQCTTGSNNSADGITFCIQNDPRGPAAVGGAGGSLGYGTSGTISNSVALEFNIYAGNGLGGVGVAVGTNGSIGTVKSTGSVVINNSDPIYVALSYLSGKLAVTLTDSNASTTFSFTTNVNIPAIVGGSTAYVGFTGSTGGSDANQEVNDFNFVSLPSLTVGKTNGQPVISWYSAIGSYVLQQNSTLNSTNWVNVTNTPTTVSNQNQVVISPSGSAEFYRLFMP